MAEQQQQMQLAFVPSPGVGHLAAMVELANLLVHRHHTLFISVLVISTPSTAATVTRYTDSLAASPQLTLLHLPADDTHPAAGGNFSLFESQKPSVREAVSTHLLPNDAQSPARLAGFVLDMFCTTMTDVAEEFGVPSYIFFTSAASALGFMLHIQSFHDEEGFDITEFEGTELAVPSFAHPLPRWAFPSNFTNKEGVQVMYRVGRRFRKSKGILVNTVRELESYAVDSLSSGGGSNSSSPKLYPVGPVLNLNGNDAASKSRGGASDEVMEWLDQQPECSVVFLCFGSMGAFKEDQVREIAYGLESSGQRFLWSLRRPAQEGKPGGPTDYEDVREVLPEGFVHRTTGVGKVIGWALQTAVLAHKSVGGFVSHCGWNSILESLWFGVPVAAWPMYAEQQLNAFFLVEELEVATEIKMDHRSGSGEIVTAEEIERGVRTLMERGAAREERVKRLREEMKKAMTEEDGSSSSSIAEFIEDAGNGGMRSFLRSDVVLSSHVKCNDNDGDRTMHDEDI